MLQTLVDSPEIKIQVQNPEDYYVCGRCKGAGVIYATYTYGDLWLLGWYIYQHWPSRCPVCHGQGYWKVTDNG